MPLVSSSRDSCPIVSMKLSLSAQSTVQLETLARGARSTSREVCALLLGTSTTRDVNVGTVVPVPNRARSVSAFAVGADDYARARLRGVVVGVFHTHSQSSSLSRADKQAMSRTRLLFLVGSMQPGREQLHLRAYMSNRGGEPTNATIEVLE